ncbi:MAG: adenylosuccinate lyase [Planctomycetota bacterium]|nr:adenylosuccinate lyase [Planctomycetota bacterium]
MTDSSDTYRSPLGERYASRAMRENFSERRKFTTWRALWIELARAEKALGLAITTAQIDEMVAHANDLNLDVAAAFEKDLRHDVMAQIHAWGEQVPTARPIIHLGATSCFVTDNAEILAMREGVRLLRAQLVSVIAVMREFALEHRALPTLGFTHFQAAQAVTVGKRACLWLQDLVHDLEDLDHAEATIRFRGVKGTTGTQASFLELFDGDHAKVRALDVAVTKAFGFERSFGVTGQTYPRQLDFRVCQVLSSIAQSAHKFATDMRLLAHKKEIEEPFESKQIGSSAMPWKRNPMRSERMCSLARFVIEALGNTAHTAANQWLERTLDDSANRRIVVAEMFLATDAVLNLYLNVAQGLVVNPHVIRRNLDEELPFLASENLMMEAVKLGADRQDVHECVRKASHAAARAVKNGEPNPLKNLLAAEPMLANLSGRLDRFLDPSRYIGRAAEQVVEYVREEVDPLLERHRMLIGKSSDVRV